MNTAVGNGLDGARVDGLNLAVDVKPMTRPSPLTLGAKLWPVAG